MLVNLRHILTSLWDVIKIPKGMGQLTCLRTLPVITLEEKKGFDIRELGSLPLLSGDIEIRGLAHIRCKEDVAEASLKTKEGITHLTLWWTGSSEQPKAYPISQDEEIMDRLHPHSNLESILVLNFGGKRISSWLPDMNNLKTVELRSCWRCEHLPTLGQLCFLESISISRMGGFEVVDSEFYHKDDRRAVASTSSSPSDMSRRVLFPRLKHLGFEQMPEFRDWVQQSGSTYELFPCLEELVIRKCPSLVSAPTCFQSLLSLLFEEIKSAEPLMINSINLTHLIISRVEQQFTSLSHLPLKYTRLKTITILDCKELGELWPTLTPQFMDSLEELQVEHCVSLTVFPNIERLSLLRVLAIHGCKNLSTLVGLERCVSIEQLTLSNNTKLELIPDLTNLSRLTSLIATAFSQQMSIPGWLKSHLHCLRFLEMGRFNEELDQLDGLRHLPMCLKELKLHGGSKIISLTSELQFLNQLESLNIVGFEGIERLPECLGELSSLQSLHISNCKMLKYLPSLDAMGRLTQLRKLFIFDCSLLKERCRKDGGEEWPKISHISKIIGLWE